MNDNYQKAIYVVPKPDVLLISNSDSPLATDLSDLYKLTIVSELPVQLQGYKAVVLDDQRYNTKLDRYCRLCARRRRAGSCGWPEFL